MTDERFGCNCGGATRTLAPDHVEHACKAKYAPATSFYDGVPRFVSYVRIQINPALTNGAAEYNWFVDWQ